MDSFHIELRKSKAIHDETTQSRRTYREQWIFYVMKTKAIKV